jgi:glutathione S-transferase kappa 1
MVSSSNSSGKMQLYLVATLSPFNPIPLPLPPHSTFSSPLILTTHQPQRALCNIKATFPTPTFESIWLLLFQKMWTPPNQVDITKPELFKSVLSESTLFSPQQVEDILSAAGQKEWKDKLLANTQKVLDQGAFGSPWMWVRNWEGKEEPFFGSDR